MSKFWKLSHAQIGGCSDGNWTIYSVHRLGYLDPVPLSQSISLPVGSVHRVIDARAGNGRPVSCPSDTSASTSGISCHTLFPLRNPFARFVVPSAFSSTGWCLRTLTLQEKLALRDCSADLIKSLSVAQQRILWYWEGVPSRVLGLVVRGGGGKGKGLTPANMLEVITNRSKHLRETDSVNSKLANDKVETLSKASIVESNEFFEGGNVIRKHNATVGKLLTYLLLSYQMIS